MNKIGLTLTALLLGGSIIYGFETGIHSAPAMEQAGQGAVSSENTLRLVPKRSSTAVIRAQHPAPVVPMAPFVGYETYRVAEATPSVTTTAYAQPTADSNSTYVIAELENLRNDIQQLQKDTAKPDPKKTFSTPRLSGRLFFDSWASPDYTNKAGMNELRFTVTGTGYEVFDYKAEFTVTSANAASSGHIHNMSEVEPPLPDHTHSHTLGGPSATTYVGQLSLFDAWIGVKNLPGLGYFRVGHYNLESSMNYLAGSTNTTLTSWHPSTSSFLLGRKFGCSSEHLFANDRVRWIYGIYQGYNINNGFNTSGRALTGDNQGQIFNTRLTMAPHYAEGGRHVLHIGGHYSYLNDTTQHSRVDALGAGNNWFGPVTLTTGAMNDVRNHNRGGLELSYQRGPIRVQLETFVAKFNNHGTASGTTTELAYFLTGEHRAYNLATATFGAPTVNRPFRPFKSGEWNLVDGWGAWQVVARHAYTDLGDWREASGGYQHDWTFGINWFWTTNIRCIFEYTHSNQRGNAEIPFAYQDAFGTSFRVNW